MKQEEKEQQLREAAEKLGILSGKDDDFDNAILEFAKSEAAKAYHKQTESVNLDELAQKIHNYYFDEEAHCHDLNEIKEIIKSHFNIQIP